MGNFKIFDILIDNPVDLRHELHPKIDMDEFRGHRNNAPIIKTKFKLRRNKNEKFGFQIEEIEENKKTKIVISSVSRDSIADRQGILMDFELLQINDQKSKNLTLDEIISIIKDSLKINLVLGVPDTFEKYEWNENYRVVKPSGKVTDLGYYDDGGFIEVGEKKYEIIMCHYQRVLENKKRSKKNISTSSNKSKSGSKVSGKKTILKTKDSMKLKCNISQILDTKTRKGLMIHDVVYTYLQEDPRFKIFDKKQNLYNKLLEFSIHPSRDTGSIKKYVGEQDLCIYSKNVNVTDSNYTSMPIKENKNDTYFIDPRYNERSKKRIMKIIDKFLRFCVETQ